MEKKSRVFAALATAAISVGGIAVVVMLASIVSTTGKLIDTAHGSEVAEDGVSEGFTRGAETGETGEIDQIIATHLDNAEIEVMQGNNTAAILELVRAIRLVHGLTETALQDNSSNQTAPPVA